MFKVGDELIADRDTWGVLAGSAVRVVVVGRSFIGVETYKESGGHSCGGSGKDGHCWNVDPADFHLNAVTLENK